MTEQGTAPKPKAAKGRSPNYPGIDLGNALARAEQLYGAQRDHAGPVDVVLAHWGYAPKSGGGLVVVAALKKFGLLVEQGKGADRKAQLSDLALDIIQDTRPNSSERAERIKRAALHPAIHREVWERYSGNLPEDPHLLYYLQRDRGFTEHGAKGFITQFKRTIAFAQLDSSDSVLDSNEDSATDQQTDDAPPPGGKQVNPPADTLRKPGEVLLTIPGEDSQGTFKAPRPLTEDQWRTIMAQLEIHKHWYVSQPDPAED